MRAKRTALATLAVVAVCSTGAATRAAAAETIALPSVFAKQIRALDRKTDVPIVLPGRLPWSGRVPRLYPAAYTARGGWVLELSGAPGCNAANACFVASFAGRPGTTLDKAVNLRLPGGQPARYERGTCGASCGPAVLRFVHRRTVHVWRLKDPPPGGAGALARLAAGAIAAGPR